MRLIDADALKAWVEEYHTSNWGIPQDELIYAIGSAQTIDPVKHGRWVCGCCSQCGYILHSTGLTNYCPNCGAKMDGGKDEHTD